MPELFDELIEEILLRLPPYKPECIIRCSAVCKPWRRLLTGPAFLRRYRAFQGTPPLLGALINLELPRYRVAARFVRTTSFRPRSPDHHGWCAHDSRHGRVLFHAPDPDPAVWDPVTGARWEVPLPPAPFWYWTTSVLCAAAGGGGGCDHLDCHGRPFLVAFLGTTRDDGLTFVCVYSSEAAVWGDATYAEANHPNGDALDDMDMRPSALVSNTIYFISSQSKAIVEHHLGRRQLAFIDPPFAAKGYAFIMRAVGGGLGFAGVSGTCLHLWSRWNRGMDATQSHRAQHTALSSLLHLSWPRHLILTYIWGGWLRGGPRRHLHQDTCWDLRDSPRVSPCQEGVQLGKS
ncbi:hypothetical protein BAE44_0021087 [Dichanthelium oligosanthes]|uniref:F-box domain-containing protein n=1 Tax=Dichanthelium oligosanthes TaxID=888268 RepID=A0A1E5UY95_9POAL|nr:hypothetical protein BAE44_0021087 [Dichanthelium oligosanthes]